MYRAGSQSNMDWKGFRFIYSLQYISEL